MADTKITEMPAGTLSADDLLTFVDNPSGSPANKKIAYSSLESGLSLTSSQISDLGTYATEAYVDAAVAGLYDHKGGYDASANSPDLDTSPSGILKGDAYTVSTAGTFFTAAVDAGDVLIADQDSPTLETHWTIVNRNIDESTFLLADGTRASTGIQELLGLNLTDSTELTIASGAITVTQSYHTIDTESDAATDDLDTITVAGGEGDVLVIRPESSSRTVVIKHGTGNVQCVGNDDITLDDDHDFALLIRKDASNWMAFTGGGTAGGGSSSDCCLVTTAKSANYTAAAGDLVDVTTSGDVTITLPSSPSADDAVGIFYKSSSGGHVIVSATQNIFPYGVTSVDLWTQGDYLYLQYNGSAWLTTASSRPHVLNGTTNAGNYGSGYRTVPCLGGQHLDTVTLAADLIYYIPVQVSHGETLTAIAVDVTASASVMARLGLYTNNGGVPETLITAPGEVSFSSMGKQILTISEFLLPGVYWLAVVAGGTGASIKAIANANAIAMLGFDIADRMITHVTESHSYAALPATVGTTIAAVGDIPRIQFK